MITEDILVKYLAGETEPHEVAMIEKWRKASEANEKHFRQLETLWIGSEGLRQTNRVDVDAAWEKVQARMKTPAKGKVISLSAKWLVAASIVLLLGLAVFFVSRSGPEDKQMISLNATKSMQTVQLSDGSRLLVKSGQVTYPGTFEDKKRKVRLHSGKVFFEIAPDKERPFEIEANQTIVTVLGTKFEVVSYADYTQVIVKEGKVRFSTPGGESILSSGMAAKYVHKDGRLENMVVEGRNTFAYTSGQLVFDNDRLGQVIADINRFYDSQVELGDHELGNCAITSTFYNEKLENVLAVISGTLNLEIEHVPNSNRIILKGKGCNP